MSFSVKSRFLTEELVVSISTISTLSYGMWLRSRKTELARMLVVAALPFLTIPQLMSSRLIVYSISASDCTSPFDRASL